MQRVETKISATDVWMRYANNADPALATEWVEFRVPIARMARPSGTPLADPETLCLAELHRSALDRVQTEITAEIRRLQE